MNDFFSFPFLLITGGILPPSTRLTPFNILPPRSSIFLTALILVSTLNDIYNGMYLATPFSSLMRGLTAQTAVLPLVLLVVRPPDVCFGCGDLIGEAQAQCRQRQPCEACHYGSHLGGTKDNPVIVDEWSPDGCWCCSNTGVGQHPIGCGSSECQVRK